MSIICIPPVPAPRWDQREKSEALSADNGRGVIPITLFAAPHVTPSHPPSTLADPDRRPSGRDSAQGPGLDWAVCCQVRRVFMW
uniref:Uncharacterized protein n=1 Tax=Knipowitschia caucasica TaxID=637954 RepID=A0AAV2JKV7_KNICA